MNCIDVHRKLTTEPSKTSEGILAHLAECSACANFAKTIEQFDQTLINAANINVPDGLAERILLKQNFKQQSQQRSTRTKIFAIAASFFIVLGISLNLSTLKNVLGTSITLEEVAINHVVDEIKHLDDKDNVQLVALNDVLQPFNIQFKNKIGQINYAGACPIRNSRGVHIVLQENSKTVTLLVMPGEYVKARQSVTKGNFTSTILPLQNGSIAIITDKEGNDSFTNNLEKSLRQTIQYI